MKRVLILVAAAVLLLSTDICSAQTPSTPKQKAKYFTECIFQCLNDEDFGKLEKVGNEMGAYFLTIDEKQGEEFGREFAAKIYEYSEKYGYGEEFAEQFLTAFSQELLKSTQEE